MTENYFAETMEELGFHTVNALAVGVQKGWPCSVAFSKNTGEAPFELRIAVVGQLRPVVKALKKENTPHTRWLCEEEEEDGVLVGLLSPPSDFYAKSALHGSLAAAQAALAAANLQPSTVCPLCGGTGCDSWAYLEDACRPVHGACLANRLNLPQQDTKLPVTIRGHYLTGILGALLGAGIGALPNWAQALSSGAISSILYAFIPFVSALLYRLFRGKARRLISGLIVLLASLTVAFLLELVWFWLLTTTQAGYNISLAATTALYFEGHTLGLTIKEMLYSLLFLLLGFLISAILLRRYAASGTVGGRFVRGAAFVKRTAFTLREGVVCPSVKEETENEEEPPLPPDETTLPTPPTEVSL